MGPAGYYPGSCGGHPILEMVQELAMTDLAKEYWDFIQRVEYGEYEEVEIVRFIELNLITGDQKQWLERKGLSILAAITGGWAGELEEEIQFIFDDWNNKCGTLLFRVA
jgi:hypothetical protein